MTSPQPLVFAPSQKWDGNDGHWSTFILRVGTPEQNFRVLPASKTGEVIVPHVQGCSDGNAYPENCGSLRGVFDFKGHYSPGFQANQSSTWSEIGIYGLELETRLGYQANASYGLENVGLMLQHSGGPTLTKQVVGSIGKKAFYVGLFGLSPKPANFSDFDYPQPSYISTLKAERIIPSISYGYTAGAYYQSPKVFGSLTLGGYDESRFVSNHITFPFDSDDSQPTSLKVQRISVSNALNGSASLLEDSIYVNLDFTVPHLWLPYDTCDRFASVFNLRYDNSTDLYLIDEETHDALLERNPTITIGLGASANPTERVNIDLPYAAFDLEASHPIYQNSTRYFPIRRANDSQYTLGRVFMQEAYVIVDYERGNFSVHQALFPSSNEQRIVTIPTKDTKPIDRDRLDAGQIVAIAMSVAVLLGICIALAIFSKRRKNAVKLEGQETAAEGSESKVLSNSQLSELSECEKLHGEVMSRDIFEMHGDSGCEVGGDSKAELECVPCELPGESLIGQSLPHKI
ncbi:aspartic peptidase domain-containing protein [Pyrenochaeta sp. MPI-SDFR-AT-0127]|nr:aspartic peptidase domain-containing protein [Pyrenochaeta sp. MPI-SDFR-AT-0127]